jgi:OmcA/MtrC family decaheme c-type cytochrome
MRAKVFIRTSLALAVVASAFLLASADGPVFSGHDKAAYLSPDQVNFVRPGLVIKITKVEIAADGTVKTSYSLTDPRGDALDREGIYSPGTISVSMIAARIPRGEPQYTAYTTRVQTSPITGASAIQATTDSGGTHQKIADGQYVYTFATKLPAGYDRTVTHTIGAHASRNLSEFELGTQNSNSVYNFVPDGSPVKVVRDVVRTATCNKCHHSMGFHGSGARKTMEICVLCHTPQTWDPDTVNTVDMVTMIHKIHMGEDLPSVKAGKKYQIIGNSQNVHDYSHVAFPADARNCQVCHETANGATQSTNMFRANRDGCGSCHDDVNFTTGAGHVDLPQVNENQCAGCHTRKGELEFDASVSGAHVIPNLSASLPGVVFNILAVDGAAPGKYPTVTFTVKNKAGQPIRVADMARLRLHLTGPTSDYPGAPVTEDVRKAEGTADGRYFWTFQTPLPATAKGTYAVTVDGRNTVTLLEGTKKQRTATDAGANKFFYFPVDGSKVAPRHTPVSAAKCNVCHTALPLVIHGGSYSTPEMCVVCHYPARVSGSGAAAVSIDFRMLIHKIHAGPTLARGYKIGTADFAGVGYPGILQNCQACHATGGEQLPAKGVLPVSDPNGPMKSMPPSTAACLSCHDKVEAASHAMANTTALGESCATCHGPSGDFSVSKVHTW